MSGKTEWYFMGIFTKAVNFTIIFFALAITLEAAGISIFSGQLFTPLGVLLFFISLVNELGMIYF